MQARILPFSQDMRKQKQSPWYNVESAANVPYEQTSIPEKVHVQRVVIKEIVSVPSQSEIDYNNKLKKELTEARKTIKKDVMEKLKTARTQTRKELAEELKSSRAKLKNLKVQLQLLQGDVDFESMNIESRYFCQKINVLISQHEYPAIPPPTIRPHPEAEGIPEDSGIYFFWANGVVEYVGQSVNLKNRLKLGSHHQLKESDAISFVLIHKHFMTWAENFYIGILQPMRNYGSGGSHNKHKPPET